MYPSPTIAEAELAGFFGVDLQCKRCGTTKTIPFASIKRPPAALLAALDDAGINCRTCGPQRWKLRARLIGLRYPIEGNQPSDQ